MPRGGRMTNHAIFTTNLQLALSLPATAGSPTLFVPK